MSVGIDDPYTELCVSLKDTSDLDQRLFAVDEAISRLRDASKELQRDSTSALELIAALAKTLELPVEWTEESWLEDPTRAVVEAQWRAYGVSALTLLRWHLATPLDDEMLRLQVFVACARFMGDDADPWITSLSSSLAQSCIKLVMQGNASLPLVQRVLLDYLRPVFLSRPHTSVNPASGRALARPRGGPGYADLISSQDWKGSARGAMGSWNVLAACLACLELAELESCWHLLVPPLMTILDDHEIPYRIRGIRCMRILLAEADSSLLRRTGLDRLLTQSLTTSLTFLSFPEHAPLIAAALPAYLALIDRMHPKRKELHEERFDALCTLTRDGPLAIWTYAIDRPAMVRLCVDFLPRLLAELGICSARFLDSLIPPLTYILRFSGLSIDLHIATADALSCLLRIVGAASHLLARWRGAVLAAVGMCSVQARDKSSELDASLRNVVGTMRLALPAEVEIDLARLRGNTAPIVLQELFASA